MTPQEADRLLDTAVKNFNSADKSIQASIQAGQPVDARDLLLYAQTAAILASTGYASEILTSLMVVERQTRNER